jgi:hypothetical protein
VAGSYHTFSPNLRSVGFYILAHRKDTPTFGFNGHVSREKTSHAGYIQHIILDIPRNSTSLHQASHNLVLIGEISKFLPTSTAIFVTHFRYLLLYYHSMSKIISNYISILPWYFPNYFRIYFPNDFQLYLHSSMIFLKLFPKLSARAEGGKIVHNGFELWPPRQVLGFVDRDGIDICPSRLFAHVVSIVDVDVRSVRCQ